MVAIGIGGWTARYLGPKNLGILSYVAALVGLLGPLGNLGIRGSLSAMLCEKQPQPGLLGSALLIELIGTAVIAVVLIPFAWVAREPVIVGLIGISVLGNLLSSSEVFEVELLNRERGTQLARVNTIQILAGALLSMTALMIQAPLLVFGSLPACQSAFRAFLLGFASKSMKPLRLLSQASWQTSRALMKRGWPLLLAGLSVSLYMKSDQVMLEWMRGPEELGQYSVAVKVAESLYFLPVILSNTILPRLGAGTGFIETDRDLRYLYKYSWILGIFMTLLTFFIFPFLIIVVYGGDYDESIIALKYLAPCGFAVSSGVASAVWLNLKGGKILKLIPIRTTIAMVANIFLNLVFIPSMGIAGAALATSISYYIATFAVTMLYSRETRSNALYLIAPLR